MAWPQGKKRIKTGGRVKGVSKNKDNTALFNLYEGYKEVMLDLGGKEYIASFAEKYPREFMAAAVKLEQIFSPSKLEITGANGGPIPHKVEVAFIGAEIKNNQG
jgi:hypothetical protein